MCLANHYVRIPLQTANESRPHYQSSPEFTTNAAELTANK